jgi:hypothetical protein
LVNVVTPLLSGIGVTTPPGKPTARKAQFSSGLRKFQEANAGRRKATGIHNRPDTGLGNEEIPDAKAR